MAKKDDLEKMKKGFLDVLRRPPRKLDKEIAQQFIQEIESLSHLHKENFCDSRYGKSLKEIKKIAGDNTEIIYPVLTVQLAKQFFGEIESLSKSFQESLCSSRFNMTYEEVKERAKGE